MLWQGQCFNKRIKTAAMVIIIFDQSADEIQTNTIIKIAMAILQKQVSVLQVIWFAFFEGVFFGIFFNLLFDFFKFYDAFL